MKQRLLVLCCLVAFQPLCAQRQFKPPANLPYHATPAKTNSLVHTKLDVRFNYAKRYLYGKARITLEPYAYATDSLVLDAKGMYIGAVALAQQGKTVPLHYSYDSLQLHIRLPRSYRPGERYTVLVDYTARPDELKVQGSTAITGAKGLYFINPDSTVKHKPVQIWTQGETEASSAWFPTIDKPNQKMTTEISITVPGKYTTLSNGRLVAQQRHANGTRTDTWKMDLPHAPYLVMMAVGSFAVIKDRWKNREVSYYVEPAQAPYARKLFGNTPEMMTFFSRMLGIDYPWNKYAQVVVRDYVSGAMENTTAVVHGDFVYMNDRQLLDGNIWEGNIAHELFHHWFGDYVTTESWSQLTVNESFANYSEMLWYAHKYGQEEADYRSHWYTRYYLRSPSAAEDEQQPLVRFHYRHPEELMDAVTYQKGGRILHMLRHYLGSGVFFEGMRLYLSQHAFGTGNAEKVRLAMEAASGLDLKWFFDQWYYRAGHPHLDIQYAWDPVKKTQTIYLQQTQPGEPFILPLAVDIYSNGNRERKEIWMLHARDTFNFALPAQPALVNVDADKALLAVKTDHRPLETFAFQYGHAPLMMDRMEAVEQALQQPQHPVALRVLQAAAHDRFYRLRKLLADSLQLQNGQVRSAMLPLLLQMAQHDSSTLARAAALQALGRLGDSSYLPLFRQGLESPSYSVQAAALNSIAALNLQEARLHAQLLEKDARDKLVKAIMAVYEKTHDTAALERMKQTNTQ